MKLYEAKEIIKDVFENSFDKEKFAYFTKNLLKNLEEKPFGNGGAYKGNLIPRAFQSVIRKMERIGKFEDNEGNIIDVLVVELHRDHSIEYARTTQRNFIRWYLNGSRGGEFKDAALVAFHTEKSPDWRFSLIKMQYSLEKGKDIFTPAKRSSFLVGEHGKSHTAQQQLIPLLQTDTPPYLSDLEQAFNIEAVSDEFYEKYKAQLFNLKDELDKIVKKDNTIKTEFEQKNIDTLNFAKKLLGQIVFLYFLQKKGWLGLKNGQSYGEGNRNFMRELFNKAKNTDKNFFNDYLEFLFYDALSKKRTSDFYEKFNCRIPFLDGGLFDPINFYDWEKTDIIIPNELFSNKSDEDDEDAGILDIFDLYNFTIKEDEPLETEVAIDPEMLGKTFERMLEVKERKSKGAFYTPREIVHYMAQQSLIYFLKTELEGKVTKADLETFIRFGEQIIDKDIAIETGKLKESNNKYQIPESIRKNAAAIDKALENIKICDPAVGSGAFPVGVMNEIVKLRNLLTEFIVPQTSSLNSLNNLSAEAESMVYFDKDAELNITRRNLPHWSQKDVAYFVTFRLADSIPKEAIEQIKNERQNWEKRHNINNKSDIKKLSLGAKIEYYKLFSKRYDDLLDNGYGSCILRQPRIKKIIENVLKYFDRGRYILDKYVVMPNHVHVIVIPKDNWTLDKITHSWKSYTANEINKITGNTGQVWMHESFDHIIRNEKQLHKIRKYIEDNPKVKVPQTSGLSNSQAGSMKDNRIPYFFKANAIQNSIYGVDIDAEAVEITKLRLWLSMVVDESNINRIDPLPNLEYKIVRGNSLINMPEDTMRNFNLENEIQKLTKHYYTITDKAEKHKEKQIIDQKIGELLQSASKWAHYKIDFDFKLYFHEVFNQKGGFDVVIGNPPYIQLQKAFDEKRKYADLYKNLGFETFEGTGDIYALFYEKGLEILHTNGFLTYITSNKWMRANYGKSLRRFFRKKNPLLLLDLGPGIFSSATVDTNILLIAKTQPVETLNFASQQLKAVTLNKTIDELKEENFVTLSELSEDSWIILSPQEQKIKERIEQIGTPLKDWDINIYRGVLTGYNEAFIIDGKTKDALIAQDPKSAEIIKPILRGRDIKRYKAEFADLWLIFIPWHFPLHKDPNISGSSLKAEKEFQKQYPAIYNHLLQYKDRLSKRNKAETGIRYEWYALQRCAASYYQEFEKEKIVFTKASNEQSFTLSLNNTFLIQTAYLATGSNLKYLLSLLNSEFIGYCFNEFFQSGGIKGEITYQSIVEIPIPKIPASQQKPFEILADYILFLKSQPNDNKSFYFEQIIDGMVYELYFGKEIKKTGCEIIKHLGNLQQSTSNFQFDKESNKLFDKESNKLFSEITNKMFDMLYDKNHPVRKNLKKMINEVEEVKIIIESLEK